MLIQERNSSKKSVQFTKQLPKWRLHLINMMPIN